MKEAKQLSRVLKADKTDINKLYYKKAQNQFNKTVEKQKEDAGELTS